MRIGTEFVLRAERKGNAQMGYPHWLIVAGAVLVVIGLIGLAFSRNREVEPDLEPTDVKAKEKRDGLD